MLTRTMLLALGKDTASDIGALIDHQEINTRTDALITVRTLVDEGITSDGLLSLAGVGKKLGHLEKANQRMAYFVEHYGTGGVAPEDKPAAIRKAQRLERMATPKYNEQGEW